MELPDIPQDDLIDVMEMTRKMEECINNILKENDFNLAVSALMSATINCLLGQCKTLNEVVFYRNLFMQIFDGSIRTIRIQGPQQSQEPPSSSSSSS